MTASSPLRKAVLDVLRVARTVSFIPSLLLAVQAGAVELPVACVAGACGVSGPTSWISSGSATPNYNGNQLTIDQTSDRLSLNWSSFNVSADGRVVFRQPSSSSVALNRIFQGNPSRILGSVEANGEIYLINPNGFVFGQTARINAAGILASTLGMTDETFNGGLLTAIRRNTHALQGDGRASVLDIDGNPVRDANGTPLAVQLVVEQGAELAVQGTGSRILLASHTVDNAGKLSAPDGQVILAAGNTVYLDASSDPALRGLLVEVNEGGEAWNRLAGEIVAPRGNITAVGLAVNQQGRMSATTTVSANGTIRLLARDTVSNVASGNLTAGTSLPVRAGTLELGGGSVTSVLPEFASPETAVDDQTQVQSSIDMVGRQITARSGAQVIAPGGAVSIAAMANPQFVGGQNPNDPVREAPAFDAASRVRIEAGVVIDVSGSSAQVAMERNLARVELRASELRDSPVQRDGPLRGQAIVVDTRVVGDSGRLGTDLADVSSAVGAVSRDVAERTSRGGTISITSDGDIVVAAGATLDVSGGVVEYAGGTISTSQLIRADGTIVDIGQADADTPYVALINPVFVRKDDRWGVVEFIDAPGIGRYEAGYVQGQAAGTLRFAAPAMSLSGTMLGAVTIGPYQLDPSLRQLNPTNRLLDPLRTPVGGTLNIGASGYRQSGGQVPDYRAPSIAFSGSTENLALAASDPLSPDHVLQLSTDYLARGFTQTRIFSNGTVAVPAAQSLQLSPGATFALTGYRVDVAGSIVAPAGSIELTSDVTAGINGVTLPRTGVNVGSGVTLDVSGLWTNTYLEAAGFTVPSLVPAYRDGGSIELAVGSNLAPGEIVIGDGARFVANGGAWLQADGSLTPGDGGAISILAGELNAALQIGAGVELAAFGLERATGGSLAIEAGRVAISHGDSWAGAQRIDPLAQGATALHVGDGLFSRYGFADVEIIARGSAMNAGGQPLLSVNSGSTLDLRNRVLQLGDNLAERPAAESVAGFAAAVLQPEYLRQATRLHLGADPRDSAIARPLGGLAVEAGASITGDAGSTVRLTSVASLSFDGSVRVPSGVVSMTLATPGLDLDAGFQPDLAVRLGPAAVVDVSGAAVLEPNDARLNLGEVLPGGTISLRAERGAIDVRRGSTLNVAGASAPLDVVGSAGYMREQVGSAAGSIELVAPEAIALRGTIVAAPGAESGGTLAGGSLAVRLTRNRGFQSNNLVFPTGDRIVSVVVNASVPDGSLINGLAEVAVNVLSGTGIDALTLEADNRVQLGAVDVSMARSIAIDAPILETLPGASTQLSAQLVRIGGSLQGALSPQSVPGAGQLNVNAGTIDLFGTVDFQGMARAMLSSSGDLRLQEVQGGTGAGALRIAGDLTLAAARIYSATDAAFVVTATGGTQDAVLISQTSASPGTPLSVNGSLTINGRTIVQGGTILQPFGQVALNASEALAFSGGSVTSVSAAGSLLPYGLVTTVSEALWINEGSVATNLNTLTGVPNRSVDLSAPSISMANGAVVDLRGGGDLYAYEWVPGTGGSRDALSSTITPGLYAVLPELRGQLTPVDLDILDTSLSPGDGVYLAGIEGLDAGVYPLLPARYALLPGAFLVAAVPGTTDVQPGAVASLPDGTPVVAGYRTSLGGHVDDSRFRGFAVQPGSAARELATYRDFFASTYFTDRAARLELDGATTPADAGSLVLRPSARLDLQGRVLTAASSGGFGATIAVSAPNLSVVAPGGSAASGRVSLEAGTINGWNPGRLVLGAVRDGNDSTLQVTATTVALASGAELRVDELIAVATASVTVESGAGVITESARGQAVPQTDDVLLTLTGTGAGDAAVLALSDVSRYSVARPDQGGAGGAGLVMQQGSSLATRGAILIEAPGGATLAGSINEFTGSARSDAIDLLADRVYFANTVAPDGITVTPQLINRLSNANRVRIEAAASIDLVDNSQVGNVADLGAGIRELQLSSPLLRAGSGTTNAAFYAEQLTLRSPASSVAAPALSGNSGTLTLGGGDVRIGPGAMAVEGFGNVRVSVTGDLVGEGDSTLSVSDSLMLTSARITTASGADMRLTANGRLSSVAVAGGNASLSAPGLGGALRLTGDAVELGGLIQLSSGLVELRAQTDLSLLAGAVVDVSGRFAQAAGKQVATWGGTISLDALDQVILDSGSRLSVSGAAGADAGSVTIYAGGIADASAQIDGNATAARGGSFELRARSLGDFADLNGRLEAGGFSEQRAIHVSQGDLAVGAGATVTARVVDLVTDASTIDIAGAIIAVSSPDDPRSEITLLGGAGVRLQAGASLRAVGTGAGSRGGVITLGASTGTVALQQGAVLSGSGTLENGRLVVRVPGINGDTDAAVGEWAATLDGLHSVSIEPVLSVNYGLDRIASADWTTLFGSLNAFAASVTPALSGRITVPTGTSLFIQPGIEVRRSGNLGLDAVDLRTWRFGGQPGAVTVRASGNLTIDGTISDGFITTPRLSLLNERSATLRFTAGADLASVDPTAVARDVAADLSIGTGAVVRTGTGDLTLAATRDLLFLGIGSSVYTGGLPGSPSRFQAGVGTFNFATGGGQLSLNASRDIAGFVVAQSPSDWLSRQSSVAQQGQWAVDLPRFGWNAGSFGGGDVTVRAGHDVSDLTVAAVGTAIETPANSNVLTRFDGGVLALEAGNNLLGPMVNAAHGVNRLLAGGSIIGSSARVTGGGDVAQGAVLSIQQGEVLLRARDEVVLSGAVNPTLLPQPGRSSNQQTHYVSYDPGAAVNVAAAGGDVAVVVDATTLSPFLTSDVANNLTASLSMRLFPQSLDVAALSGNARVAGPALVAGDSGQLAIFAAGDVQASDILMSDAPDSVVPSVFNPTFGIGIGLGHPVELSGSGRHLQDGEPSSIVAGHDVLAGLIQLAEATQVDAGRDISGITLLGQNVRTQDVTRLTAGRDIRLGGSDQVRIGGPGRVDVLAGRQVDLGVSLGLTSVGRLANPNLPVDGGADINLIAGLGSGGVNAQGFLTDVVAVSAEHRDGLIAYVAGFGGVPPASYETAASRFLALNFEQQRPYLLGAFFSELVASGREANLDPEVGFSRGYAAIDALFPGSRGEQADTLYSGDLSLAFSRIYTISGGTISLVVPGGLVNVGLANPPPSIATRDPSQLGIVAQGAGSVRIFAEGDVLVNQSRIFTLRGGDIAIWSSEGDIDAGRGSKSALSAPPPRVIFDNSGRLTIDFSGAVAGSGIRTITTADNVDAGDVDLIAPKGIVNAGDAGIGSAGNLNIAAQQVAGLDNIQVGGVSTGVPAETSGIGASLSGVSASASSSSNSATQSVNSQGDGAQDTAQALAVAALSWLEVFVVGLGEENCRQDDLECLKRQNNKE